MLGFFPISGWIAAKAVDPVAGSVEVFVLQPSGRRTLTDQTCGEHAGCRRRLDPGPALADEPEEAVYVGIESDDHESTEVATSDRQGIGSEKTAARLNQATGHGRPATTKSAQSGTRLGSR